MGEAKRRSNNPRNPETDAKVVAVRDMRIDFPGPMRQNFMRVANNNVRSARNAVKSSEAFDAFMRRLFGTEKIVMVCYVDLTEASGIGVVVAKGLDALMADIQQRREATAWTAFVVDDHESACRLGIQYGDMAMVTVPFDGGDADEMEAAVAKAHSLAAYEMNRERMSS